MRDLDTTCLLCSCLTLALACGPEPLDGDELAAETETETGDPGDGDGDPGDGDGAPGDGDGDPGDGDGAPGDGDGDGDGFGDGPDTCEGPDLPEQCDELAAAIIEIVAVDDTNADGTWSPGEDLIVTVLVSTQTIQVNYPALVSQTDHPLVTVPWITAEYFAALPDLEPLLHTVTFTASPELEPGTAVNLKIAAATGLGQFTDCDCPDVTPQAWIQQFVIE